MFELVKYSQHYNLGKKLLFSPSFHAIEKVQKMLLLVIFILSKVTGGKMSWNDCVHDIFGH